MRVPTDLLTKLKQTKIPRSRIWLFCRLVRALARKQVRGIDDWVRELNAALNGSPPEEPFVDILQQGLVALGLARASFTCTLNPNGVGGIDLQYVAGERIIDGDVKRLRPNYQLNEDLLHAGSDGLAIPYGDMPKGVQQITNLIVSNSQANGVRPFVLFLRSENATSEAQEFRESTRQIEKAQRDGNLQLSGLTAVWFSEGTGILRDHVLWSNPRCEPQLTVPESEIESLRRLNLCVF